MEQKQIDITDPNVTVAELYKLALEQQKNVTNFYAQMQQAQANVKVIEDEIAKREAVGGKMQSIAAAPG